MKLFRFTRWRLLFALLLGVGTWWGVSYWLTPRPHYTLRYPNLPDPLALGKRTHFHIAPLGREGKLMLVITSDSADYQVVELATGKTLATDKAGEFRHGPQWRRVPNGDIYLGFLVYRGHEGAGALDSRVYSHGYVRDASGEDRSCIWEYDLVTKQARTVYVSQDNPSQGFAFGGVSSDGTTLFENTGLSLAPFSLLTGCALPGTTPLSLASIAHGVNANISLHRFWSLPSLEYRCLIAEAESLSYTGGELSADGNWLVYSDQYLTSPWTSQRQLVDDTSRQNANAALPPILRNRVANKAPPRYLVMPKRLRVYNTHTGVLHYSATGYTGSLIYRDYSRPWRTIVPFTCESDQMTGVENDVRDRTKADSLRADRFLHLPSATWLTVEANEHGFREVPTGSGFVRWIAPWLSLDKYTLPVWETSSNGTTRQVGELATGWGEDPSLVPNSTLAVQVETAPLLSERVSRWLKWTGWFGDWVDGKNVKVVVRDYVRGLDVWSMTLPDKSNHEVAVTTTGSYLLISTETKDGNEVTILPLPIHCCSPWWARMAALLVLVVGLLVRTPRPYPSLPVQVVDAGNATSAVPQSGSS